MPRHPARYSAALYPIFERILTEHLKPGARILDPFAGTGGIHHFYPVYDTVGVELEPEWAAMSERTIVGDALELPFPDCSFDAVVTSPTYGNRMADHHDAKDGSRRITYRHSLGRPLGATNSGAMQWGDRYRHFHERAWREAVRVLKPDGVFVLNVSDHVRNGQVVPVCVWHLEVLAGLGWVPVSGVEVRTPRMGFGANRGLRPVAEGVFTLVRNRG